MKTRAVARLAAWTSCLLILPCVGCYDVVPAETAFGPSADTASVGVDTASLDSGEADSAVATSDSGAAPDSGATLDGGADTGSADVGQDGGGKLCTQNTDCGVAGLGCAYDECVKGQCVHQITKDGVGCQTDDKCLTDMTCKAGVCQGGNSVKCECKTSADCASKNGGDKCLGEFYCDTSGDLRTCKVNPVTIPKCPEVEAGGCVKAWKCEALTGGCKAELKPDIGPDSACDDGDFCTAQDHCQGGVCYPGSVPNCACKTDTDCAAKGSLCGGTYYCDTLSTQPNCQLIPSTAVVCDASDDGPCAVNTCDETNGKCAMKPTTKQFVTCDDGNPCTKDDTCKAGTCAPGTDVCGCKSDSECAKFDDGDLCNGVLYCDTQLLPPACKLNPATVVVCPSGADDACQTNECGKTTGKCAMAFANVYAKCDADGTPCTVGDWCDGKGACNAGTNICTCTTDKDCASKEDGDLCNGTLYCDTSGDLPGCKVLDSSIVTCAKPTAACTENTCTPKTGKCKETNLADNTPCEDGKPCTKYDTCQAGKCDSGTDFCACTKDADCFGVGDLCKGKPFCDKSGAVHFCSVLDKTAVDCATQPKDGCFASTCDPLTGACKGSPDVTACKDDGNPCTIEVCDAVTKKCVSKPQADGATCGAGKICAENSCVANVVGMVLSPASSGWAGCNNTNFGTCPPEALPPTEVTVKAVFIDRYEVTVAQYEACINAKACASAPSTAVPTCNWSKKSVRANHPVNCVSWLQASEYCKAQQKRLPTEAEWERAARGGCDSALGACKAGTRVFPWGNEPPSCFWTVMQGNGGAGCGLGTTRVVGTFQKDRSPYGAQDMGGNVAEWVLDTWDAKALSTWSKTDPVVTGGTTHTAKGGHLNAKLAGVRAFSRIEGKVGPTIGFRCAMDLN